MEPQTDAAPVIDDENKETVETTEDAATGDVATAEAATAETETAETAAADAATDEPATDEPATDEAAAEKPATKVAATDGEEDEEAVRVYSYIVSTRTDRETIEGREAAVNQAKEMTADGSSVQVERADGRVRMQFRDGSLVEYVYETRKGRTV